jgi:hypothetical protein
MSKINNVRLPNASLQYSPEQFNQLVRSLEQIVFQLNNSYTPTVSADTSAAMAWLAAGSGSGAAGGFAGGVRGFQPSTGILLPHAMFMDTTDQESLGTTSENIVQYNTPIFEYGIRVEPHTASFTASISSTTMTVTAVSSGPLLPGMTLTGTGVTAGTRIISQSSGTTGSTGDYVVAPGQTTASTTIQGSRASKLKFDYGGEYLVTVSCQVTNRDNSIHEFELWAKNTGVNYPLSNTRFDVPERKSASIWGHAVAAVSGIFTVDDPVTQYLEMAWWSNSTLVYLQHYNANTNPTRPEVPSVILTVNQVSATGA